MNIALLNTDIVVCEDAFTVQELSDIQTACTTYLNMIGAAPRKKSACFTAHVNVPRAADTKFFYSRIAEIAKQINEQYFNFDIQGYTEGEGILYLEYNELGDNYDWHVDNAASYRHDKDPVKLILVLQLTDPLQYTGCDAEVAGTGITEIPKKRGLLYAMPGYTAHRVTPLLSGKRSVLSCWFTGPKFK